MAIKIQGEIVLDYGGDNSSNTNISVGVRAGANLVSGAAENTAIGYEALNLSTGDLGATAVGYQAGYTYSSSSVAVGYKAAYFGIDQGVAIGYQALYNNPGISYNTAVGYLAMFSNAGGGSFGNNNTAVGWQALYTNVSGWGNVAIGSGALLYGESDRNTAVGEEAMANSTSSSFNVAIGYLSMQYAGGVENVAVGVYSLQNTTSSYNTGVGFSTLISNTTGQYNTAIGYRTSYSNTTGSENVSVGYEAAEFGTIGSFNTAIGLQSLRYNEANYLTAVGYQALYSNTTGTENLAIGYAALYNNTTGQYNTAIGSGALYSNTTGSTNLAIGSGALYNNTTGSDNIAIGDTSLYFNTTGRWNVGVGAFSLRNNTTGIKNTVIGYEALLYNVTGSENVAVGYDALLNALGNRNLGVGTESGKDIMYGSNNVVLGSYTGAAAPISGNGNNWIVLSDGAGNIRQVIDSSGNVGIGRTSAEYSLDVVGTVNASAVLVDGSPLRSGYQNITSAAGTTTLTASSPWLIIVSGSTTQTIQLPDVTTLTLGRGFKIINTSTGTVTVQSSGGNSFTTLTTGLTAEFTVISLTGTTTASWSQTFEGATTRSGTGSIVYGTAPTLSGVTVNISQNAFTSGTNAQGSGTIGSTSDIVVVTTTAANPSGVTLSASTPGRRVTIINRGTNPINVYPPVSSQIDALGTNNPFNMAVGGMNEFNCVTATLWYSDFDQQANNAAVGAGANAYANLVGAGSNNYLLAVIAGANTAVGLGANNYANASFVRLTAESQTINGNINIIGNLTLSGNTLRVDANTLVVQDPLIYLAGNNYSSDIVDIGFIANYVNATGQNVHTGLYREHADKMYYLFQGYDQEPINNHIGALSNNMTLAVLNADLRTSNLILGGTNAISWITAAFNKANAAGSVNVGNNLPPAGNTNGSLWWNTDLGRLLIYYVDEDSTSQWVEASPQLVGPTGPTGATGDAGNAATIALGTVTTGDPGTNVSITNSGNSTTAVFNFTIPRGNTGAAAPRAVTIEYPQANDVIPMFYNFESFPLTEIRSVLIGTATANVTFSVRYATSMAATGTEVITNGIITTNTTNGKSDTSFTNGTIPSGNFVWVRITAATNTTNVLHISMR